MIDPIKWRNVSQKLHQCKLFINNGLCRVVERVDLFYYNTHRKFIFLYMYIQSNGNCRPLCPPPLANALQDKDLT